MFDNREIDLGWCEPLRKKYGLDDPPPHEVFAMILFKRGYSRAEDDLVTREEAKERGIEDAKWRAPDAEPHADQSGVISALARKIGKRPENISAWLSREYDISQQHWENTVAALRLEPEEKHALFSAYSVPENVYALEDIFAYYDACVAGTGRSPPFSFIGVAVVNSFCVAGEVLCSWEQMLEDQHNSDWVGVKVFDREYIRQNTSLENHEIGTLFAQTKKRVTGKGENVAALHTLLDFLPLTEEHRAKLYIVYMQPQSLITKEQIFADFADGTKKTSGQILYELMATHAVTPNGKFTPWHEVVEITRPEEAKQVWGHVQVGTMGLIRNINKVTGGNSKHQLVDNWINRGDFPSKRYQKVIKHAFDLSEAQMDFLRNAPRGLVQRKDLAREWMKARGAQDGVGLDSWEERVQENGPGTGRGVRRT